MAVGGKRSHFLQLTRGDQPADFVEPSAIPVLQGLADEMCGRLEWPRDRFGVNDITAADELADVLAPVVERLFGNQDAEFWALLSASILLTRSSDRRMLVSGHLLTSSTISGASCISVDP